MQSAWKRCLHGKSSASSPSSNSTWQMAHLCVCVCVCILGGGDKIASATLQTHSSSSLPPQLLCCSFVMYSIDTAKERPYDSLFVRVLVASGSVLHRPHGVNLVLAQPKLDGAHGVPEGAEVLVREVLGRLVSLGIVGGVLCKLRRSPWLWEWRVRSIRSKRENTIASDDPSICGIAEELVQFSHAIGLAFFLFRSETYRSCRSTSFA